MKTRPELNQFLAKLLTPILAALALLATKPTTFADPPTISDIPDVEHSSRIGGLITVVFVVNDDITTPGGLGITTVSSNTELVPNANIIEGGSGADRTITLTPVPNAFGSTQITLTVTDSDNEQASKQFIVKVTNDPLDLGVLMTPGGLGNVATVAMFDPLNPNPLPDSIGEFHGPFELYSALDLGGVSNNLAGIGNISYVNAEPINGPDGLRMEAEVAVELEGTAGSLFAQLPATVLHEWSCDNGAPPVPNVPEVGSGLSDTFRPKDSYYDNTPWVANEDQESVFEPPSAWHYVRAFAQSAPADVMTPAIGLIYRDSVSNAIAAGDSVPTRPVEPPPGTGTTFTAFDAGAISINSSYVAFYGSGDLFSGIYTRRLSDGELFAAVESFTLQPGNLGLIWGAFLADERDIFFNAAGGIWQADAEGATPAELVLANGTEYEPGKVFGSGNLLHVADDYGVIAGIDGNGKSTIFRLNLTDFSLEQIVQQGDAAPGGGTFGLVQRPAVSDAMVVFEGFDDSFKFLGLFAYLFETQELKAIARVGEIFAGKEVRTLGSHPGALNGSVFGFTVYFIDNSSAAYLTTPAVSFSVPFLNISTRSSVQTGDNVLILGYIITANPAAKQNAPLAVGAKKVIIRAIGPSLGGAGVQGPLADPVLELYDSTGALITSNDNWRDTQEQEIIDSTIPPTDDLESAIVATLDPGAYTAIVRGKNGGTGVGLVEIYDLDGAAVSEQANISTRSLVQTGEDVMIGGIIVGGDEDTASTIVVRAIGPSLGGAGVANPLQDPVLELHDSTGALVASNDNWKDTQQDEIEAAQLAPTDDRESALEVALNPGAYTAIVRGAGATTGVGLVEAYNLEASGLVAPVPAGLTNRR